ncbi:MAG: methyltransferase domain-containing protein [Halobacteriota archaeon]
MSVKTEKKPYFWLFGWPKKVPVEERRSESTVINEFFLHYNRHMVITWNEQYAMRSSYWRGPYDITPVTESMRQGASILDVGCGTGRYLVPLERAGFDVLGIDISCVALRTLCSSYQLAEADLRSLPFAGSSFDAITCFGVLQHLSCYEREVALRELFRVLKPQGLAFLEVIGDMDMRCNCREEVEPGTFVRGGIPNHHFSSAELSTLLEATGFAVVTMENRILEKIYGQKKLLRHSIFIVIKRA